MNSYQGDNEWPATPDSIITVGQGPRTTDHERRRESASGQRHRPETTAPFDQRHPCQWAGRKW